MKKSTSIKLIKAPILYQFLQKLIKFDGGIELQFDMGEELMIEGRCICKEKDCATVYLKRAKEWKAEQLGSYFITTSKGIVIFHFSKNGFMEVQALNYELYPYKYEIQRVLKGDYMEPNALEILLLEDYFLSLEQLQMQTIIIDG